MITIVKRQFSFFFRNKFEGDIERVSLALKETFHADPNNETVVFFPVPREAPDEFPRLRYEVANFLTVNVSKSRLDLFTFDENYLLYVNQIAHVLIDKADIPIGRISYVQTGFQEEGSIEVLKKNLTDSLKADRNLIEVAIRINKTIILEEKTCNNIESVDLGIADGKPGILITRDISTHQTEVTTTSFSTTQIKSLMAAFIKEAEHVVLAM